jgi:ABC-type cobalamin transport system ATPase subunit
MIIKVQVYFEISKDGNAKIQNVDLIQEKLRQHCDDTLSGSYLKLAGSWWDDTRLKARHLTVQEALETLRTKS